MTNPKRAILLVSLIVLLLLTTMPLGVVKAQEPLFKITLIAPGNANMVRRQWGQIFANSLQQLGIDARVVYLNWQPVFDRVLTPLAENVGKTYDEGGFDIQLIGWTPGLIPEPRQNHYGGPGFWAPTGQNYYLWNNTQGNLLLDTFITTTDVDEQNQTAQAWQSIFFNELPASQIFYAATPAVVTPELGGPALAETPNGPGWLYFNAQPSPEFLTGKTAVVYASTGEIESLVPPLSNSWYDTIINAVIFNGLAQIAPDLSDLSIPALLTSWTPSNNGFKWTFECRTGVKWHDGFDFTADDVVFSLWALMNPDTGTQFEGYYKSVYGDNIKFTFANGTSTTLGTGTKVGNITAIDADTVEVWLPELIPGKPYGYFDPYLLTFANNIIPMHIFGELDPAAWTDSVFNTGVGSTTVGGITYTGPVGTGPYKWVSFEPAAQLVHLEKFNDYWNRTNLEAAGYYEATDYYIKFIVDKTPAIAALKNEQVDMLDPNYQMQVDLPTIDPAWGRVLLQDGTGRQEIGYNMQHPIIGTGVDTPLGQSNPARAAEAARYVRTAFDYAVPRQLIIDNLLAGFGDPGATPMLPTQPYFNASITPRPYDLATAREFLEMAGYTLPGPAPPPPLPSFILGMSNFISGYFTDSDGNPLPNRELLLMETPDNATYETTSSMIGRTTTDLTGWYGFTVTPGTTGPHYYYLFDRLAAAGTEWRFVKFINASTLADAFTGTNQQISDLSDTTAGLSDDIGALQTSVNNLTIVAAVALIVAIVFGVFNLYMMRRKP